MNYGGYEDSPYYEGDGIIMDSDLGDAPRKKVIRGNCHIGTLHYQQNLNLDVYRSASVEADIPLSLDESHCIACVRAKLRNSIKSTVSIDTTNGSRGGRNTVKLMARGSRYESYEHFRLNLEVFVVRKTGYRCDPI